MENAVKLEVPNKVDYEQGANWGETMIEKYLDKFMVWQLHNRTEIAIAVAAFVIGAILF